MQSVAIVILAAGASSRMGSIKQLLPWKETTLLGNAINEARSIKNATVYVVLGANAQEIIEKNDFNEVEVLLNPNWKNGLGSSLAYTVSEIDKCSKEYNSILVVLADQPLIDAEYLTAILHLFNTFNKNIVATQYKNRVGVPAVFAPEYMEALQTLEADFGAKEILKNYKSDLISLDPKGKECDVDTQEDYENLIDEYGNKK